MQFTRTFAVRAASAVLTLSVMAITVACNSNVEATTETPSVVARAAVSPVKREPVSNQLTIAGEFLPFQEVELHAKVAGYVRRINVDIGDHVRAGQVLAVLEVPELNAQVVGAQAGVRHSDEEIARAKNELARAKADHDALHTAAVRLQQASAARPGLIAQQELDNAESRDRASEAQVEAAKSALAAKEQQAEMARATQTQISAMQDYSRIVAPFDGVVTWRYADTGALIQAGTSNASSAPVVKLAQVNMLRLRLPIPESLASQVHVGLPVEIQVQAASATLHGKVSRSTEALDRSTRTMQVEVDVPNKDGRLSPGMYANVALQVDARPDALAVPVQALQQSGDHNSVLVVSPENVVEVRQVRTGIQDPNRVEVIAGLREGERVIVGNLSAYQPGQRVQPKERSIAERGDD